MLTNLFEAIINFFWRFFTKRNEKEPNMTEYRPKTTEELEFEMRKIEDRNYTIRIVAWYLLMAFIMGSVILGGIFRDSSDSQIDESQTIQEGKEHHNIEKDTDEATYE